MSERSKPPPIAESPKLKDDSAPLEHDKTPTHGIVSVPLMMRKLAEAEARMTVLAEQVADKKAREATKDERAGRPRVPPSWIPWLGLGFVFFTALSGVVVGDAAVPVWLVKVATVGTAFFGGALALSTGLRRK